MSLYLRNSFAYLLQNKAAFLKTHKDFVPLSSYNYPSYTTISLHKNQVNSSKHHKAYLESFFLIQQCLEKCFCFMKLEGEKTKQPRAKKYS